MAEKGSTTQKPKLSATEQILQAWEQCNHDYERKGHDWDEYGDYIQYICRKCGKPDPRPFTPCNW